MARLIDTAETTGQIRFEWRRPSGRPAPFYDPARGVIVTRPNGEAVYYPFEIDMRTLPTAFAKVVDERTAVAFTRKYGQLGFWHVAEPGPQHEGRPFDPTDWVLAQAATVRFALEVIAGLPEEKLGALQGALASRRVEASEVAEGLARVDYFVSVVGRRANDAWYRLESGYLPTNPNDDDVRAHARRLLATLVNENTAGVRPVLRADVERLRYGFTARALIEVIWKHVGDAALGGRVKICEACFAPFIATDARQNYCPPDPATDAPTGKRIRSKCEQRARRQREQGSSSEPKDTP